MLFALLFVFSFCVGLAIYTVSSSWLQSVVAPSVLFVVIIVFGGFESQALGATLAFGVPIVFFGSLFGAYIVQLRRGIAEEDEGSDSVDAD